MSQPGYAAWVLNATRLPSGKMPSGLMCCAISPAKTSRDSELRQSAIGAGSWWQSPSCEISPRNHGWSDRPTILRRRHPRPNGGRSRCCSATLWARRRSRSGSIPEELREILTVYQTNVGAAVIDERGYLARFVGDGVLAYFGWPNADEAHAESAVRAGLTIVDAVGPQQLSVRIGIATGLVVTGDLVGVGAAQTMTAVGETPNLAARLQALAQPNTIVVSEATQAQLGHLFELQELGLHTLKGFAVPVRPWRVLRKTEAVSRSEVVYAGALTRLVGRDEELGQLLRRWHEAKASEGRVVLLSGEAGIGKSRLLAALEERLTGEPHVSQHYFCSPHHQDSPLSPPIARLEREAGLMRGDTAEDRLIKLEAALAPTASAEDVALLAALLSIPTNGRYPIPELSPQQRKTRTFTALLNRLAGSARREPVLMPVRRRALVGPELDRPAGRRNRAGAGPPRASGHLLPPGVRGTLVRSSLREPDGPEPARPPGRHSPRRRGRQGSDLAPDC